MPENRNALHGVTKTATSVRKVSPGERLKAWSQTVSLRAIVTATVVTMVAATGGLLLRVNYSLLKENKTRDVWAIYFLEMESRAKAISEQLLPSSTAGAGLVSPSIYAVDAANGLKLVSGMDRNLRSAADFGIKRRTELAPFNLVWKGSQAFAIQRLSDDGRLAIAPFAKKVRFKVRSAAVSQSFVYIATRQGRLVYSNSSQIDAKNFQARPLVQKFITLPVSQGQLELTGSDGKELYGFFMEIPNTNLVILAETRKDVVLQQVTASTRQLVYIVLAIVGGISLLLFVSMTLLLRPVGRVAGLALKVATGDFDVKVLPSSLGEIRTLTQAFAKMIAGLKDRDARINELMRDQETRLRLENELAIAKTIQENLLPATAMPPDCGIAIRSIYTPATEVAGDWYGFFYDPAAQATVVAVVDISGHGVGSSMFTAIVAAMFEEFRESFPTRPALSDFFDRINRQLRRFGRDAWHATALGAIFKKGSGQIELTCAGHPRPIIYDAAAKAYSVLPFMPSLPLGMLDAIDVFTSTMPFLTGQSLMIFTDGLYEWRTDRDKPIGLKTLIKTINAELPLQPSGGGQRLFDIAKSAAKGAPQTDDVCIITVSAE